jgi:hypothetical protein
MSALYFMTGSPGAWENDAPQSASYLRGQVDALGLETLDTTAQDAETSTAALARSIALFAERAGVAEALRRSGK